VSIQPVIDEAKQRAFVRKALGDLSSTTAVIMAMIGDRLGLFKALGESSPTSSQELASRAGIDERYAREWLGGMAAAGYLEYDPDSQRFTLPPEYSMVLAQEGGPKFVAGAYQVLLGMLGPFDQLLQAFRNGGGVHQSAYGDNLWDGLERFTGGWFENLLLPEWMPAMPDVLAKLQAGASVADVGCGRGRALIKLAQEFPNCNFTGFDVFPPTITQATANAEAAGVAERVAFQQLDVTEGLPYQYDIITTFDVVHDAANPQGLLRSIRQALNPGGFYLLLDINCSESLEENLGSLGTMFHGFSILYCMTTSLANDGAGLGTLGLHPPKVQEMCAEAGFNSVRLLPLENPFHNLYEIRP
jgi:2-polyprenyl-3-methyl-5-hydroxy-6-metoxy-1,4-benzoquinol methylase